MDHDDVFYFIFKALDERADVSGELAGKIASITAQAFRDAVERFEAHAAINGPFIAEWRPYR